MNNSVQKSKNNRNLLGGFDVWERVVPHLSFIAFILGWFSVTLEVFFRRDFGERYFNRFNFVAGFIVLGAYAFIQSGIGSFQQSFNGEESSATSYIMVFVLLAYLIFSTFHFFTIWWRDRTGKALHSLDSGKSWLEPLAWVILGVVNIVVSPIVKLLAKMLPAQHQQDISKLLPILRDKRAFAEQFLEPLVGLILLLVVVGFRLGTPTAWLLLAIPASILYTTFRYEAERQAFLDIRDNIIEADEMKGALDGKSEIFRLKESMKDSLKQIAIQVENSEKAKEIVEQNFPSVLDAMEAMNPKLHRIADVV